MAGPDDARRRRCAVVEFLNVMVFVAAVVVAAILVHAYPSAARPRLRRWGWGFRIGPLFFWRR